MLQNSINSDPKIELDFNICIEITHYKNAGCASRPNYTFYFYLNKNKNRYKTRCICMACIHIKSE